MDNPLTDEQIREFLTDLGLPQVDPGAFRAGTLPELLRASIDMGRIRPVIQTSGLILINHVGPAVAVDNFPIAAPGPREVITLTNITFFFNNALTETFVIEKETGPVIGNIWVDFGGPFAFGPYIGTDNTVTQAWANKKMVVYGSEIDFLGQQQIINVELQSAAAVGKNVTIAYDSTLYRWEDWPGNP